MTLSANWKKVYQRGVFSAPRKTFAADNDSGPAASLQTPARRLLAARLGPPRGQERPEGFRLRPNGCPLCAQMRPMASSALMSRVTVFRVLPA